MKYLLYAVGAWIAIVIIGYILFLVTDIAYFGYPLAWSIMLFLKVALR